MHENSFLLSHCIHTLKFHQNLPKPVHTEMSLSKPAGADYQVFLSFRGPDTRQGFTDCLYHFLVDAGVRVFRDNEEIRAGERIEEILRAIKSSVVCIPIFSKDYASSKWCLRELAEMVEQKKRIMPIFYDVTPDDVKLKTHLYQEALAGHEKEKEKELWEKVLKEVVEISGWESPEAKQEKALKEVVKIKGWELRNTGHGELCKSIVKEVLVNLKVKDRIVTDNLVGMQEQVEEVLERLDIRAPGVRYMGIHGMGGSGKTTLAKAVFNRISASFDRCSFLADVRESSRRGLDYLQKKLIRDLREKFSRDISDTDDGIKVLRDTCRSVRTLIVLDDVDSSEQIEGLAGSSSWFCSGSRIIVTTRDLRVLAKQEKYEYDEGHGETSESNELCTLEMKDLDSEQALHLFSRHAFETDYPPVDYLDVSKEVVSAIGHLPLALEIIGSHLCGKHKEAWEAERSTLVKIPQKNIQKTLMLSYDALDFRTKQIFLDIACLPVNLEKINAFCMWRSCGFRPEIGIEELISLSLIKIDDDDVIWMHDHVRDLGREIICMEDMMDPGVRSRLWDGEEAFGVLKRKVATRTIEVLQLPTDLSPQQRVLTPRHVRNLRKLRFLQCDGLNLVGDFEHQLPMLRWLSWHHCPDDFMATNLNLEKLAILELCFSKITEDWEGWKQIKVGESLEVLDLSSCSIRRTPDLSQCSNLTRLILEGCSSLNEIDSSIGKLKCLKHLNLIGCSSLQGLPAEIGSLRALEKILLGSCRALTRLPESIGNLKSLVILYADYTDITKLPHTIGKLRNLECLSLRYSSIKRLPETLGNICSLITLNLSGTLTVTELPDSLGGLKNLERLDLSNCSRIKKLPCSIGNLKALSELNISGSGLIELPDSIGDMEELIEINMAHCYHVHELPRSIGNMKKLERLIANGSALNGEIPIEIGRLSSLQKLELSNTNICMLPSTMSQLSSLEMLWLTDCNKLEELPMLPTSLLSLRFTSKKLKSIPDISVLSNLADLVLYNVDTIPLPIITKLLHKSEEKGKRKERLILDKNQLELKKSLELCMSNLHTIPTEILDFFPQLESLQLGCPELVCLPQLPPSLSNLVLMFLKIDKNLTCISNLKNLSDLTLFECSIGEEGLKSLGIGKLEHLKNLWVHGDRSGLNGLSLPKSLQFLLFSDCKSVKKLPDLSHLKNLQVLKIQECEELFEVPGIGGLRSLREIVIKDCKSWKGAGLHLPASLEELSILSCTRLEELPDLSHLRNLEVLKIKDCKELLAIRGLGMLESLEELCIEDCMQLKLVGQHIPVNLKKLRIVSCTCLCKYLKLRGLKELQELVISNCDGVVKISGLEEMESLQELSVESCNSLKQLLRQLPVSLQTLKITSCANLKRLPDVSNLKNLQEMSFDGDAEVLGLEELKWLKGEYNDRDCIWRYESEIDREEEEEED